MPFFHARSSSLRPIGCPIGRTPWKTAAHRDKPQAQETPKGSQNPQRELKPPKGS